MPIYEYECYDCNAQVEIFFRSFTDLDTKEVICPNCEGTRLKRRISKVAVVNAAQAGSAGQSAATSTQTSSDKDDPKTLAQKMRHASQTAKQDMGREFNEVAGRLERGEKASSIEKSLRKRAGEKTGPH